MGYFGRILEDGRIVMSSYDDIKKFFDLNRIVGRRIASIEPARLDYMIKNIQDFYPFEDEFNVSCAIETDGFISLVFEDGFTTEIEFAGEGPVIFGTNGFPKENYPENDGKCYLLNTMFEQCLGKTISDIRFEKSSHRMLFPIYMGIDMSDQDDGINEIRIVFDDNSQLVFWGNHDYFEMDYRNEQDEDYHIDVRKLISELSEEVKLKYKVLEDSMLLSFFDKISNVIKEKNNSNESINIDIPFVLAGLKQATQNNLYIYTDFFLALERYADYSIEICKSQNEYNGVCDIYVNLYREKSSNNDDIEYEPDISYIFSFIRDERYCGFCDCKPSDADYREDKKCCGHGCDWAAPAFTFYKREKISHEEWDGDEHTYWDFEDSYYALDVEEAEKKRIRERAEEIDRIERHISELQERLSNIKAEQ